MQKTGDRATPEAAGQAAGMAQAKPGLVAFTGTGPGDTGLLTLRAADLAARGPGDHGDTDPRSSAPG